VSRETTSETEQQTIPMGLWLPSDAQEAARIMQEALDLEREHEASIRFFQRHTARAETADVS